MKIRRITNDDYADYLKIRMEALADSPTAFGMSVEEAPSVERANFEDNTSGNNALFLCYSDGEDVCGMVGVRRYRGEKRKHIALIWGMYVTPGARTQRVGLQLMEEAVEFSRETGIEKLQLSVNAENVKACGLYKKIGFEPYGTEKNALKLDGRYHDEHLLEMFL